MLCVVYGLPSVVRFPPRIHRLGQQPARALLARDQFAHFDLSREAIHWWVEKGTDFRT